MEIFGLGKYAVYLSFDEMLVQASAYKPILFSPRF